MFLSKRFPGFAVLAVALWFCGVRAACPLGDLTGDCVVSAADLGVLADDWLAADGPADLNADNDVNMVDFGLLAAQWGQEGSAVIINELHVNPDVKTERVEFVELHNLSTEDVDLSGWSFTAGVFYTFPAGATLPAGGYVIVTESPEDIQAKFGTVRIRLAADQVFGPYGGRLDGEGERVVLCDAAGRTVDEVRYGLGCPWPIVGDPVPATQPGSGPSMQLVYPGLDNDLGGSWRSAYPTPLAANSQISPAQMPPHVRQVRHEPKRPRRGEVVTITAKVTDDDGIASVVLRYQPVQPGAYIARQDPQYGVVWIDVPMHDDGLDGDVRAGDDVYTGQVPASVQVHRHLVRYRVLVVDQVGNGLIVPYADDPQPNFAYFVYDGVPAWRGAVRPGVTPVIEFPAEVMRSLPVYHLITKKSDVEDAMWLTKYGGSEYRWWGTLVYDGQVYDHIRYRMRGGVWRYSMGKHMFKYDFNRGHYFQAHDDYGRPYDTTWDKLNFSACIQQGSFGQRGEQGMFEALSFRLFNMAGVPASKTNYVHFRVIDEYFEDGTLNAAHPPLTTSGTQYDGDFFGLHMTIEQMDGRFLDEHSLPDGNLYKMDNGNDERNNQGPTQPSDFSDLQAFLGTYRSGSEPWWRQNVHLDSYYGYYAIYQAIHHGDITGKNWFLYHHPETDQWWQLPWDVDLTWTTYYGSNDPSDPFSRAGALQKSGISLENKNRLREITDLLFNPDQTNQLIDEYAAIIDDPAGGLSMVDADRCLWDRHWVVGPGAYPKYLKHDDSFKAGQGRFYEEARQQGYEQSFEGMVQVMKDYVVERMSHLDRKASDSAIPDTPTVTSTSPPGFPSNALTFTTSAFRDPQGTGTFGAMKWRIAEVAPGSQPVTQIDGGFVLLRDSLSWKYFEGRSEPSAGSHAWRQLDFDDSNWSVGSTPIGFGEGFLGTTLADMRYSYGSVYLRKSFEIDNLDAFDRLLIDVLYDDGVNLWINGQLAFQDNVPGEDLPHNALAQSAIENTEFVRRDLDDPRAWLTRGTNVVAVQVLNASVGSSSDCFIDVRLLAEASEPGDEPGPVVTPPLQRGEPGRYEIDAAWESDERSTFQPDVTIPAAAVRPGRTYRVRARMKDNTGRWSHWSDPVQFVAGEPLAAGILEDLRVTELMYNPAATADGPTDNDDLEFVELKNVGDETLDLTGVSFANGIAFAFEGSGVTTLGPGQFVLVVKSRPAFLAHYGSALAALVAGEYEGRFANNGEGVALVDLWNGTIAEFTYGDGRGWPLAADGAGHSLVPLDSALPGEPAGSLDYPGNWRASRVMGGSPGADDPALAETVMINELLASNEAGSDWVELYNPTSATVSLADWHLSDDAAAPAKWAFPALSIPARALMSFDGFSGFGLSRDGEELLLSYLPGTGADRVVDAVRFKAQEPAVSLGRYPDGGDYWFRLEPTPDQANHNPLAGPVIDEIMYHPADSNEEYVELYNPTAEPVSLGGQTAWRLDGAVGLSFPAGLSIPAAGRLVLVGFDPIVDASRRNAFTAAYGNASLVPHVILVGPWDGSLSNGGERLSLEKAQLGADQADPTAWVVIDEVTYADTEPWPPTADGQGDALQRISPGPDRSGNDPTNWQSTPPSPGK